jgi:hypothetical protein
MLNQKNYFSNFVRHAKGGVIQCASAGGGSCGKSVGVDFVGGAAVGGGAGAFAGNYMAQGYASMVGGFAGGASGSAFNGGDGWDVLKGGLMGAGMAYVSGWVEDIIDPLGLHSSRSNIKSETTDFDKISDDTFIEGKYEDTSTKAGEKFKILKKSSRPSTAAESKAKATHLKFIDDHDGPTVEHVAVYDKDGYYVGGTFSKGDAQQVFSTTRASRYLRFHSDAIVMHNHPGGWLPSASDYAVAKKYMDNHHYLIHTNPNAGHMNGLYQYGHEGGFLGYGAHQFEGYVY